jgi:hypothetical protein
LSIRIEKARISQPITHTIMSELDLEQFTNNLKESQRRRVQNVLTTKEFNQLEIIENGYKLDFKGPKVIMDKLNRGIKS